MKVINLVLFLLSLILAGQSLFACPTCYYFMQENNNRHDIPEDTIDTDIYTNGIENDVFVNEDPQDEDGEDDE